MSPRPARARSANGRDAAGAAPAEIAERLHSAAIHLLRWLRREDRQSGLTAPRLSALSVIVFAGPITLGELAAAEQVRPPTMSRLVRALATHGLVTREPDPRDGRATLIRATPKGVKVLARGRARRIQALTAELRALADSDLATLHRAALLMDHLAARDRR